MVAAPSEWVLINWYQERHFDDGMITSTFYLRNSDMWIYTDISASMQNHYCKFVRMHLQMFTSLPGGLHSQSSRNLYMLFSTVFRSSSGDCNILPVLWITSCFHIMGHIHNWLWMLRQTMHIIYMTHAAFEMCTGKVCSPSCRVAFLSINLPKSHLNIWNRHFDKLLWYYKLLCGN